VTTVDAGPPVPVAAERRRPVGLLLVAVPVFLVIWLVIWPIISAVIQTMWVRTPEGSAFSIETYRFFFSDGYSLANLSMTLWTTGVCAILLLVV
jgi:putative spermidine/putrescine transport system permease protein